MPAQTNPVSGMWNLGKIIVLTAGTPVNFNFNVGSQRASATKQYPSKVRQFIFSTKGGVTGTPNAGNIYILRASGGGDRTSVTDVLAVIPPGQIVSFPNGFAMDPAVIPDDFMVDADSPNDSVYITGIVQ